MTKAIMYNPFDRTVTETTVDTADLDALYAALSCEAIDEVVVGIDTAQNPIVLLCDGEGRLKSGQRCFMLDNAPVVAGRALLIGTDSEGNYIDCPVPRGIASQVVNWRHEAFDYSPPPVQHRRVQQHRRDAGLPFRKSTLRRK